MLSAERIGKRYGGQVALSDGRLDLARGEVHVLMGSNGSGKSTLCKIIAGAASADSGELRLDGKVVSFASPRAAREAGITTVYQETSLVPTLSVARNIVLGAEPVRMGRFVDRAARARAVGALVASTGSLAENLDPDALVADLSIDQRQIVEILKALRPAPRIVLFDEATSSLDRAQVAAFFALIRRLRDQGCSIIFISHRLEEIIEIGDRVTILRNGRHVATMRIAETNREEIVRLMVGAELATEYRDRVAPVATDAVLELRGMAGGALAPCSLALRRGEVLGLGGLHGQGQSELLQLVFASRRRSAGQLFLEGRPASLATPLHALRAGLAYVAGDRGRAGALGQRSILENAALTLLSRERPLVVRRGAMARRLAPVLARLRTKFAGFGQALSALSGGNQQKVILGRALAATPKILLLDDPTKGIDVEAKRDLYALVRDLCEAGASVILYSSEDAELLANADRVLVFNGGRIVDELAGARLSEYELYSAALRSAA